MTQEQINAMAKANAQAMADKKARDGAIGFLVLIGIVAFWVVLGKMGVL